MYELTMEWGKGYSGKMGNRCWVRSIDGSALDYSVETKFIDADKVIREHFGRARTMISFTYSLAPGLYQQSEAGEKNYFVAWEKKGVTVAKDIDDDRAHAMIALMGSGSSAEEARRATIPAPTH